MKKSLRKFQRKDKEAKIFSTILVLFMLIIAGFLFFSNYKISAKRKQLLLRIENLKQEINELEGRNQELKQGISESQDHDYLEARIRGQGYKKPGETVVVVTKEEKAAGQEIDIENFGFWDKLLAQIKDAFD